MDGEPAAEVELPAALADAASDTVPSTSRRRRRVRRRVPQDGRRTDSSGPPRAPASAAEDGGAAGPDPEDGGADGGSAEAVRTRQQGAAAAGTGPGPAPDEDPPLPPLPPLTLRDGLPRLTDSFAGLEATIAALARGTGPLAIDTERASGYRYGQRAYLIQIRREGSGTHLIDPIAVPGVPGLAEALAGPEWILHAATQDLPCLQELGLHPSALFDTELAGRLLGMPRVGLAPMVAELLGHSLAKGHGAADWSIRPLPDDWLEYAALDVEVLLELRTELGARLAAAGKLGWAQEEFEAIRTAPPAEPRVDPWRRTAGIHQVRQRRGLAIVAALWTARDGVARAADTAPGRLLPDASIIAAARALPADLTELRALRTFHGRGVSRYQREWGQALASAWAVSEADLPKSAARGDGPPQARIWGQRDAAAAARLDRARTALARRAEELDLPVENLVTPELVRRLMWDPAAATSNDPSEQGIAAYLAGRGARPWQIARTADLLAAAIAPPDPAGTDPS